MSSITESAADGAQPYGFIDPRGLQRPVGDRVQHAAQIGLFDIVAVAEALDA